MACALPPVSQADLAWFGLVPFLAALRFVRPRRGLRLGFLWGVGYFGLGLHWLWALIGNGGPAVLVVLGHLGLTAYCALYPAVFGLLLAGTRAEAESGWRYHEPTLWRGACLALGSAVVWAGLEYLRGVLFTGFPWNGVGVALWDSATLSQVASVGGVPMVGALLVVVNAAVANVVLRVGRTMLRVKSPRHHLDLMLALALAAAAFLWGARRLQRVQREDSLMPPVMVAGVQDDMPSIFDKDPGATAAALRRLSEGTKLMGAMSPDLVVWPESALPGGLPGDAVSMGFVSDLAKETRTPILTGGSEYRPGKRKDGKDLVANVSWAFSPRGNVSATYRKCHLVPFGEYIPGSGLVPALERLSPIGYNCTPGKGPALFRIQRIAVESVENSKGTNAVPRTADVLASPLICFEDIFPGLSRRAVRKGANLLVNQSNDAWFGGSWEPAQHHAQAVFRAVETRTPLVRVSNRGVSGVVSAAGVSTEPSSCFCVPVAVRPAGAAPTVYLRLGPWAFPIPCLVLAVLAAAARWLLERRSRRDAASSGPDEPPPPRP